MPLGHSLNLLLTTGLNPAPYTAGPYTSGRNQTAAVHAAGVPCGDPDTAALGPLFDAYTVYTLCPDCYDRGAIYAWRELTDSLYRTYRALDQARRLTARVVDTSSIEELPAGDSELTALTTVADCLESVYADAGSNPALDVVRAAFDANPGYVEPCAVAAAEFGGAFSSLLERLEQGQAELSTVFARVEREQWVLRLARRWCTATSARSGPLERAADVDSLVVVPADYRMPAGTTKIVRLYLMAAPVLAASDTSVVLGAHSDVLLALGLAGRAPWKHRVAVHTGLPGDEVADAVAHLYADDGDTASLGDLFTAVTAARS